MDEATDRIIDEGGAAGRHGGHGGEFAAGVVVGALIGAVVALLFAPASGTRTRRRLGRRVRRLRGEVARRRGLVDSREWRRHLRRRRLRER